jgi:hypothetical protein
VIAQADVAEDAAGDGLRLDEVDGSHGQAAPGQGCVSLEPLHSTLSAQRDALRPGTWGRTRRVLSALRLWLAERSKNRSDTLVHAHRVRA